VAVTASPLPGPSGNVEFFLRLRTGDDTALTGADLERTIQQAIDEGPQ